MAMAGKRGMQKSPKKMMPAGKKTKPASMKPAIMKPASMKNKLMMRGGTKKTTMMRYGSAAPTDFYAPLPGRRPRSKKYKS